MNAKWTDEDQLAIRELKTSDCYKPLLKLFDLSLNVLESNLLRYSIETEDKVFNLVQLKSQLEGATKLLSLVKSQIESPVRSDTN